MGNAMLLRFMIIILTSYENLQRLPYENLFANYSKAACTVATKYDFSLGQALVSTIRSIVEVCVYIYIYKTLRYTQLEATFYYSYN